MRLTLEVREPTPGGTQPGRRALAGLCPSSGGKQFSEAMSDAYTKAQTEVCSQSGVCCQSGVFTQ